MKKEEITVEIYRADAGKTFKRMSDGEILGDMLTLGVNDSIDNYVETDIPAEVAEA